MSLNIVARGGYLRATMPPPAYTELKSRLAEIHDLSRAEELLTWDERTMMPPHGAAVRAEQLATLARLKHDKATADELGRLLDELTTYGEAHPHDSDEASLVRVARRDFEKARRVPAELRAEIARAESLGAHAWREARSKSDFELVRPYLARHLDLKLRYIDCFPNADHAYDPLLDDYEPGMKTTEAAAVLEELKIGLVPLSAAIAERADAVDDSLLHGDFPVERQRELADALIALLSLDGDSFRVDEAVHPFLSAIGRRDVRITTRYLPDYIAAGVFALLHEFGHGVYEHGIDPALERTPLCRGVSLGVHESQSRLWENMVGRSRAFMGWLAPALAKQFGSFDPDALYRAVNKVQPSLIRVEADEVTYNLHVIMRFELEQELIEGKLSLTDLPEAWNARVEQYLGLAVPDDAHGVLQDVHWAEGAFGYFPTYSLGNVIAGQIWAVVRDAIPDIDEQIERGEFGPLAGWLREHLYRHGRKFTPVETLERAVGGPIDVQPYLGYLQAKFGQIYDL
jgi:carboxypeptidase Taq